MKTDQVMLRVDLLDGFVSHRSVPLTVLRERQDHIVARIFSLDEVATWFDWPKSIEMVEPQGFAGDRRVINGRIMRGPRSGGEARDIGKITVCWETEKHRDSSVVDGVNYMGRV